jgi:hypothetical protein
VTDPDAKPALLLVSLRERFDETKDAFLAQSDPQSPEIVSLMQRLESLVVQASDILEDAEADEKPASG